MSNQDAVVTVKDLKDILAEQSRQNAEQTKALIEELRKPTILEQRELDSEAASILQKNSERKDNAQAMIQKRNDKRAMQRICTHHHNNGGTHCVFIHEQRGTGYILCQKNQCIIRPGVAPDNYKGDDIYDNALFNKEFQTLPTNELFQ